MKLTYEQNQSETPVTEYLISKEFCKTKKAALKFMKERFPNNFHVWANKNGGSFSNRQDCWVFKIIGLK